MALEIYYTSAPQGLRPGDRGFCTVAATPHIPRQLLERLEAMSGYRHASDAGPANNPVSHAHWILRVGNRDWHVLSRVCDAGLDYTQRTNALAHHAALELAEMAPAGPAWMVQQPGLLRERWDGAVGAIARVGPLPRGNLDPSPCMLWQEATGDAGWAGVVAETIAKSPWKPICLLFEAGQSLLPLVGQAVALLPPNQRWQATFNTYFTSLPGGVTCQWRCCLAGTPAGVAAVRQTASGLLIDLTRHRGLGQPPAGPWVEAARAGRLGPMAQKTLTTPMAAAKRAVAVSEPAAAATSPEPAATQPQTPKVLELAPIPAKPPPRPRRVWQSVVSRVEQAAPQPEISWAAQRAQARRRRLLTIYTLACIAIAAGLWLQIWAYQNSADRSLPPVRSATQSSGGVPRATPPEDSPKAVIALAPPPVTRSSVQPATAIVIPPPTTNAAPVAPRPAPPVIVLVSSVPPIGAGVGLRDVTRTLAVPADRFEDLDGAAALSIIFPGATPEYRFKHEDLDGTWIVTADNSIGRPGLVLQWRDTSDAGQPTPVVSITLDRARAQLEFAWRTSLMLRRPQISGLGYYVLENSALLVSGKDPARPQRIEFAPVALKTTSMANVAWDDAWPAEMPAPVRVNVASTDPAGWQGSSSVEAGARIAGKPAVGPVYLLKLEKPPGRGAIVPAFTVRLAPADRLADNDLKKVTQLTEASLVRADYELRRAEKEMEELRATFEPNMAAVRQQIADLTRQQQQSARDPKPDDLPAEEIQRQLDALNKTLAQQQAGLNDALRPLQTRQKEHNETCAALRDALAAYAQLKELDLIVELPQGLRVASLRLTKENAK